MESDSRGTHCLIYALGGGMGHLTRSIALARALRRDRQSRQIPITITLVTNSPFASALPIAAELGLEDRVVAIDADLDRDQVAARISDLLEKDPPDCFIVDTFPRGIGGELADCLPEMRCHRVLVHRDLNPRYIEKFELDQFVRHYDRILVPGEAAPFESLPHAARTQPWLIREAEELLPPEAARRKLQVDDDRVPVVAVLACGRPEEATRMCQLATRIERRMKGRAAVRLIAIDVMPDRLEDVSPTPRVNIWPFFQAIRGASIIVGGGGYNTVQESRAAGNHLIAFSWPRLYDRQSRRLAKAETVANNDDAEQRIERLIDSESLSTETPNFSNGVHDAVKAILV